MVGKGLWFKPVKVLIGLTEIWVLRADLYSVDGVFAYLD